MVRITFQGIWFCPAAVEPDVPPIKQQIAAAAKACLCMTLSPNSVSDPHHGYADLYHGTALPSTVVKRACPTVPNHCHPGFGTPPSPTVNPGSPIANSRLGLAPPLRWLYGGLVRVPGVKPFPEAGHELVMFGRRVSCAISRDDSEPTAKQANSVGTCREGGTVPG
jgi:hypothetical protein